MTPDPRHHRDFPPLSGSFFRDGCDVAIIPGDQRQSLKSPFLPRSDARFRPSASRRHPVETKPRSGILPSPTVKYLLAKGLPSAPSFINFFYLSSAAVDNRLSGRVRRLGKGMLSVVTVLNKVRDFFFFLRSGGGGTNCSTSPCYHCSSECIPALCQCPSPLTATSSFAMHQHDLL